MQQNEAITPPQPIPYPQNKIIKKIYRIPLFLYRLGLSRTYSKYILILSTFGRRTGKTRHTPVEYFYRQGRYYVMSGFGAKPDWYKNILSDPHITLQLDQEILHATARKPKTENEWEAVVIYLKSSPITKIFEYDLHTDLDQSEMRQAIRTWPILTFDPTEETCPSPLEIDLLWCWPLILLGIAMTVSIAWLCQKSD